MKCRKWMTGLTAGVAALALFSMRAGAAMEKGDEHPWNVSVGGGFIDFDGREPVNDGFMSMLRAGYDYSQDFTFEGSLNYAPHLTGTHYVRYNEKTQQFERVNRLEDEQNTADTWALGVGVDALYHFTRWERLDPYLAVGVGAIKYGVGIGKNDGLDFSIQVGGGVMYHFNDEWAVRADYRALGVGVLQKSTANEIIEAGVCWTPGAGVPANYKVGAGAKDSDADGLTDAEEAELGTDPFKADTDGDLLSDYDEVKVYHTDPLNPDTDFDGLKDGAEVNVYHTNPLLRDTDGGGVADGHEVIEDGTNPLNPADDLILFTLNIEFDYDKAIIKPQYFPELDIVGKTIVRDPGSTAVVEGHADKLKKSKEKHNMVLSEQRAQAVVDYLVKTFSIDPSRLKAKGYGFSRPKAKNDPVMGNPVNRRVEIYIRKSDQAPKEDKPAVVK